MLKKFEIREVNMPIDVCTFIRLNNINIIFQQSAINGIKTGELPENKDFISNEYNTEENEENLEKNGMLNELECFGENRLKYV